MEDIPALRSVRELGALAPRAPANAMLSALFGANVYAI
jgi:hypothetical protein